MVLIQELLFTVGISFLVFVIFVKYHSLYFVDNKRRGFTVKDLASKDDQKSKEFAVVEEKMSEKNVKFCEFGVESMYFQEIEEAHSEKNGKLEGENRRKNDEEEGLLFEDWEGIERTELEKMFGAAVVFVDSMKNADVFDSELKLKLYGLHKVATEGACYVRQPMPFKVSARAKWSSWNRLGDMSREKAMEQYVTLLSDRVADWKINNTDVNCELISRDVENYQDSRKFCAHVSQRR